MIDEREPGPAAALNRGRRAALALGAAALAAPAFVRAAGRPVLRAGDQKGGLRALLESAEALKDLPYEIQ